jgi:G6PDH family F420-dependent oxidoreductase
VPTAAGQQGGRVAEIGAFLSSEEHGPKALVSIAGLAAEAGMRSLLISDHFHPWTEAQGESPFVWSVIGAIAATTRQRITTGVTCPTVRIHPAVVAQAAATSQILCEGRFALGVGTGEALNERITGSSWPVPSRRLEMLEEAVEVMRKLWSGKTVTHRGRHYVVERARIYSAPDPPPPVLVSAFGPRSLSAAARFGDGLIVTSPKTESIAEYRRQGGRGPAVGALKVCYGEDEKSCRKLVHKLWATECLPGQLAQELPAPSHFEQAVSLVTEEMVAEQIPCGPDPERHASALARYLEAGFDEVYVSQIGSEQQSFFDFYRRELHRRVA